MSLTTLLVWALIVAAAVLVAGAYKREGADRRAPSAPEAGLGNGAEGLLAERFARGEIDDEEYARRLAVLRSHTPKLPLP
ncbi:SHOCT domain-containing protein [Streptomyces sp. NPDC097981]|uniref:SHOCT domain-containing protein n=1 Tax=Streptomyces sp. NPDC097981 TaxID=3155428 RepID=UPI00331A105C